MSIPVRMASVLVALLLLPYLAAAFMWDEFEGTSQWRVTVTDDESGCGGGPETETLAVVIKHSLESADIGDLGHGAVRGAFSGNTLTIPGRTIPDAAGMSKLSTAVVSFTPDCMGFSSVYRWDYTDPYMMCSGTTTLRGARLDGTGCPAPARPRITIAGVRADPDAASKESAYREILAKDPANFWANWDMAELKKKQGQYEQYFRYFDKAVGNENVMQQTRERLQETAAEKLGLPEYPSPGTSPLLRSAKDDIDGWGGGFIHNIEVPAKEAADKKKWYWKVVDLLVPESHIVINEIVGVPAEEP